MSNVSWRKKSSGWRHYVQSHKKFLTHESTYHTNWRSKSMGFRQFLKTKRDQPPRPTTMTNMQNTGMTMSPVNKELFRRNWIMMMVSLTMFIVIMGVLSQFTSRNFVTGLTAGIIMGMASITIGFSTKVMDMLPQRK